MQGKKTVFGRIRALAASAYFPFIILFLLSLALHLLTNMYASDDRAVRAIEYGPFFQFMVHRYISWSTRIFVDAIFLTLLKLPPILWRVLDTSVFTAFAWAVSYLVSDGKNARVNWLVALFFLLYPFTDMVSAGWITTTCVYLWSCAAIAFALVPIKRLLAHPEQRLPARYAALGVLAALLAGSQEQACCTFLAIAALLLIYAIATKRFRPLLAVETGLAACMLVVHLSSPALGIREIEEAVVWFPDFAALPFFNKLELGFTSTMFQYVVFPNLVFAGFAALLFWRMIQKKRAPAYIVLAALPLLLTLVYGFGLFAPAMQKAFPTLYAVGSSMTKYGTNPVWGDWDSFLPLLTMLIAAACVAVCLYQAFDEKRTALLCLYALCAGAAARVVLGFSPTVWGSGARTFVILYFVFIFLAARIGAEMEKEGRAFLRNALPALALLAAMQYVETLVQVNAIGQ